MRILREILREVSLTDEPDLITKLYGGSEPVRDSEVGGERRGGRLETGHPVAGVQTGGGAPGFVPLAAHGLTGLVVSLSVLELSRRPALVGQVGHVVPGEVRVVVGGFPHQVGSSRLYRDDGVEETVDGHPAVVLGVGVLRVGGDGGGEGAAGDVRQTDRPLSPGEIPRGFTADLMGVFTPV